MSSAIQANRKTLRNLTIGIACVVLLLFAYFLASSYVNGEIYVRDERIDRLTTQVSMLQACLRDNASQIENLTQLVRNLNDTIDALSIENDRLASLPHAREYELKLAWHEISVLRNQTERLKSQITELERQIEESQATPLPSTLP